MKSRDLHPDDGPEHRPPAELLRLRAELARPPGPELRARHLAATAMAARQRGNSPMGRFASRSARGAVAIVAALAITSGLAGAQLLPDQAQRLLSNVSDRFSPGEDSDPPAEPATPGDATTTVRSATDDPARDDEPADTTTSTTATTDEPAVLTGPTSPTTTLPPVTVTTATTIPGPGGPGSPDDPTDPDATTTTTTVPPTTTTTQPPTTTTTQPPTTTTTSPPGRGDRR